MKSIHAVDSTATFDAFCAIRSSSPSLRSVTTTARASNRHPADALSSFVRFDRKLGRVSANATCQDNRVGYRTCTQRFGTRDLGGGLALSSWARTNRMERHARRQADAKVRKHCLRRWEQVRTARNRGLSVGSVWQVGSTHFGSAIRTEPRTVGIRSSPGITIANGKSVGPP